MSGRIPMDGHDAGPGVPRDVHPGAAPAGPIDLDTVAPGGPVPGAREVARARRRRSRARAWRQFRSSRSGMAGLIVLALFGLMALVGPAIVGADAIDVTKATGMPMSPPSPGYPLGTDESGRSILDLIIWGSRVSLIVGLAATVMSMVIGTVLGVMAGHYKGWVALALNRFTDWFLVIPFLPLAIVLATVLGASLLNIIVVIGITSWPGTARLVRAQTLSVSARPYLERARALGGGDLHQMRRHVLPNVMPLVLANTTLMVALAILSETTLSFLGLGDPLVPSWGGILDGAFTNGAMTVGAWWYVLPPGLCVVTVVLAFTLIGRTLETIVDPRGQGGRP
jgi:peptide/nickel transport system permease protein